VEGFNSGVRGFTEKKKKKLSMNLNRKYFTNISYISEKQVKFINQNDEIPFQNSAQCPFNLLGLQTQYTLIRQPVFQTKADRNKNVHVQEPYTLRRTIHRFQFYFHHSVLWSSVARLGFGSVARLVAGLE
jgi:hypothetical protein